MGYVSAPATTGFNAGDHVGSLCFIVVQGVEYGIETSFGTKDAIKCVIQVIDGPWNNKRYTDILLFNSRVVPGLRDSVGETVLGRFAMGGSKGKAVVLNEPTKPDCAIADAWIELNGDPEKAHRPKPLQQTPEMAATAPTPQPPAEEAPSAPQAPPQPPPAPTPATPPVAQTYTSPAPAPQGDDDQPPY